LNQIKLKLAEILNKQAKMQKKKPKVKTISEISKYFYWEWPVKRSLAGYIPTHLLSHISSWT
jgi:hypothetical protein